jgi:enoyl-CoA hydratase/carnithine racemase
LETKRLMKQGQMAQVLATMAQEGDTFARMMQAPAAKEAFSAFMEKRRPDFSKTLPAD